MTFRDLDSIDWREQETRIVRGLVGVAIAVTLVQAIAGWGDRRLALATILFGLLVLRFTDRTLSLLRSKVGRFAIGLLAMIAVLDLQGGGPGSHLLGAVLGLGIYVVWVGILERRVPTELLARRGVFDVPLGFVLGLGFAAFSGWAAGGVEWSALEPAILGPILAAALFAGVCEEVLFRGMVLRLIEEFAGSGVALVLSALLFAWVHQSYQGLDTFFAGLALGACYLATRRLWLSISGHAAYNFVLGSIDSVQSRAVDGMVQSHWATALPYFAAAALLTLTLIRISWQKERWVTLRRARVPTKAR